MANTHAILALLPYMSLMSYRNQCVTGSIDVKIWDKMMLKSAQTTHMKLKKKKMIEVRSTRWIFRRDNFRDLWHDPPRISYLAHMPHRWGHKITRLPSLLPELIREAHGRCPCSARPAHLDYLRQFLSMILLMPQNRQRRRPQDVLHRRERLSRNVR
jgi:hypothetical protein